MADLKAAALIAIVSTFVLSVQGKKCSDSSEQHLYTFFRVD